MTFLEHLEELRVRLLRSLAALAAGMVAAMVFYRDLVGIMTLPHFRAMEWLGVPTSQARFIAEGYGAPVLAVMKLCLIVGLFLASPVIGREMWAFVRAGLYRQERRAVEAFAPVSFLLFLLGCVFGYFVLIPYALYGMARMFPPDQIAPVFAFSGYLSLVLTMTILLGAVFQLPLAMVLLTRLGLVPPGAYVRKWRHAAVGIVVVSAVISPADAISLLVFAVPLFVLYAAGVLAAYLASPRPGAVAVETA
jgi:Tat protein translocase TatC